MYFLTFFISSDDVFNDYKGELIDEQGERIFMFTSAAHYMSNEVIHYGKHKPIKIKGKVNYGALNYAGIQLFEIYGDPEKVFVEILLYFVQNKKAKKQHFF